MSRIDAQRPAVHAALAREEPGAGSDAWRREMERVQMADWFSHGPLAMRGTGKEDPAALRPIPLVPSRIGVPYRMSAHSVAGAEAVVPGSPRAPQCPAVAESRVNEEHPCAARPPEHVHDEAIAEPRPHRSPRMEVRHRVEWSPAAAGAEAAEKANSAEASVPAERERTEAARGVREPRSAPVESHATPQERARPERLHEALQAWLAPAVALVPLDGGGAAGPVQQEISAPLASSWPHAGMNAAPVSALPAPARLEATATLSLNLPATGKVVIAAAGDPAEALPASPPRRPPQALETAPSDPVRATAAWQGTDCVHLWLGVDAAEFPEVAPIVRRLEGWLRSQGVRLLGVTCNGRHWDPLIPTTHDTQEER